MITRCGHCGGNLLSEYDYDLRRDVTKCLACGREAKGETRVVIAAVSTTTANGTEVTAYMAASQRLVAALDTQARAKSALEKATAEVVAARTAHKAARAKFDAFVGSTGDTCSDCGGGPVVKAGRCAECAREKQRVYQQRSNMKRRGTVARQEAAA